MQNSRGFVRTFDYFTISGMTTYGASRPVGTVSAFITRIVLWLPFTAAGTASLLFTSLGGHRDRSVRNQRRVGSYLTANGLSPHAMVIGPGFFLDRLPLTSSRNALRRIKYLISLRLVPKLSWSLSWIYWLNINDPEFLFASTSRLGF
jgi:hypothetical protein